MDAEVVELVVDDMVEVIMFVTVEVVVVVGVNDAKDALESEDLEFVGVTVWVRDVVTVVEDDAELHVVVVAEKVLSADDVPDAEYDVDLVLTNDAEAPVDAELVTVFVFEAVEVGEPVPQAEEVIELVCVAEELTVKLE